MRGVLITGGMGDIGRAMARQLAADGFSVCALYHRTPEQEADEFIRSLGTGHVAYRCDIADAEAVHALMEELEQKNFSLEACVHAATAAIIRKGVLEMTPKEFKQQFEANAFGAFAIFHGALPQLISQKKGTIIGITSAALDSSAGGPMAGYVSAKFALRGLLRELHREQERNGIVVAAVSPGFVATSLQRDLPEQVFAFLKERDPNRSTPEEVASIISQICTGARTNAGGQSFSLPSGEVRPL